MGYMWHAIWVFAFMFFVVGGRLIVSIYRLTVADDDEGPGAEDEKPHQRSPAGLYCFVDCFLAVRVQNAFRPSYTSSFP